MRIVFLLPDLVSGFDAWRHMGQTPASRFLKRFTRGRRMYATQVFGGTLNIMRHCDVARKLGIDAVLASQTGVDTYVEPWRIRDLPMIHWDTRKSDDLCVLPDLYCDEEPVVKGPIIAYQQNPLLLRTDFDWASERVEMWTDSPFMLEKCERAYPGKEVSIVPNVVDTQAFPFVPQSERESGLIYAFPRKEPEFIDATEAIYHERGGDFWHFERIDGLPLKELAASFSRPQAFLASAMDEGCALPPQESMASGVVVIGRQAQGANFVMQHRKTAMLAESPEDAADCLVELESESLREDLARNGHEAISRFFPEGEPTDLWRDVGERYGMLAKR